VATSFHETKWTCQEARTTVVDVPFDLMELFESVSSDVQMGELSMEEIINEEFEEIIKPSMNRINQCIKEVDEDLYLKLSNMH